MRDDLYITVPSLFRCPISLDVMKSPVSLCTGVTYDRASIQRWLDGGNNTCPATMQVLQTKDFVPNRNLQRLIQIWSDSVRQRVDAASRSGESVPSRDEVKELVSPLEKEKGSVDKLSPIFTKIVCFARASEENREFLLKMDGFLDLLVDILSNVDARIELLEQIVSVLVLIVSNKERQRLRDSMLKRDRDSISAILVVLRRGRLDCQIESVRVLEMVATDTESKLLVAEKDELLSELVKSIGKDKDPNMVEACLSCLIALSMPRRTRTRLIQLQTVRELRNLLTDPNSSISVVEKSLKMVEALSSCKDGRAMICSDSSLLEAVLQKVLKVSSGATEHAVTTLWSMCYLFRDQKAQEAVSKSNGMTKFLLLIQSNCSPAVRQMAGDLLKIFRVNSKSCLSSYDTKTTHIMPF